MAILKTVIEESLLSKSEQAALRVIVRVQQLNEGLIVIQKLEDRLREPYNEANSLVLTRIKEFENYLNSAINDSITQHRLPARATKETKSRIKDPNLITP